MSTEAGISTAGSLGQTALALLLVVGAILALAWLLRRVQNVRMGQGGAALQVRGGLQLGARERAVWVQAGDKHLLLGVAPGRVQTLHVFDEAPAEFPAATGSALPSFRERLQQALGRDGR